MQPQLIGKLQILFAMQQKEIIGLMRGTDPYTNKTLSALSQLIADYPYFQTAHILHTLNLFHLKDTHFLFDLRKATIYAPDRKKLFFQIENGFFLSEWIEALGQEQMPPDTSLDLINRFLSETEEKAETKTIDTEPAPVSTDYISYFLSGKEGSSASAPLQHQETIDKFLEKEAVAPLRMKIDHTKKITKADEEEESDETLEPAVERENESPFFSETLAKIYMKQKKYDKALEIIRKLNLIYPEKNRYFADQIRFLEKLIINTTKIK
jgi:tetratricopeptide (TPR) repeat protein